MTTEAIAWAAPPAVTDANDGSQAYNMGRVFTLTADAPVVGVEWRVPDTVPAPAGGTHAVALWNKTTGIRLAYKAVIPTPGGVQQFLFDLADIYAGLTTDSLIATVYTNHYVYRSAAAEVGATSPSGTIVAGNSILAPYNGGASSAPIPVDVSTANFHVSPIISLGETHTTTGTGKVGVTAAGVAATARTSAATVKVAASATATSTTTRLSDLSAPVAVAASATSASVRATAGTAPLAVTASADAATIRVTTGTAPVAAAASGAGSTTRVTARTARVGVTAGTYVAATAPGPRLVSRHRNGVVLGKNRPGRIVTSTQVAS